LEAKKMEVVVGTSAAVQTQAAPDRCPWCGNAISRSKFVEIQTRVSEQERKKLAEERTRMEQELRTELLKAEAKFKTEAAKKLAAITTERDTAITKIRRMEAREAAIRKEAATQAEARVKAETEKKLTTLTSERDQATATIKQLEVAKQKDLDQQRRALEKDRDAQLLKVQVQHNRDREQLQQNIDALTRRLQRKTADELGEGAEIDVYEALRDAYRRDDITRIKKGEPGADIRHQVLHKGTPCGTILIDSKNRQSWQNAYVTKLREDQMAAKADYAILATTVFPSSRKELYTDEETRVIVVNRARAVEIVGLMRQAMVRMHVLGLSQNERAEKRELLYKYITSEDFRQHVIEAGRLSTEMLDLDADEKRAHDRVWEKRGKMTTRLRNVVREIDTEVGAIVEGRRVSNDTTK
jgi:hypothetical protein